MTTTQTPGSQAASAAPKRADGTPAPSPEHVKPHPFNQVKHKPAIGSPATTSVKFMSVMQLAILTVVAVASLRSLPAMAGFGLGAITLFIIPAIFFLIPTALVAAELATGWKGGVFTWVRTAFGERWGFQAIWLQWVQNVVWYPTQIAFIAASLAFVFLDPNLANSGLYTAIIILVLYWFSTWITLKGGNLFAKVGSWSGLAGTIFPGLLLIIFGIGWVATGQTSQIPLTASSIERSRLSWARRATSARPPARCTWASMATRISPWSPRTNPGIGTNTSVSMPSTSKSRAPGVSW